MPSKTLSVPTGLAAGHGAMAATTAVAVGGTFRPVLALGLLMAAAFVVGSRMTAAVALFAGGMGWLFYAGFISGRHAQLAWHGAADVRRLGLLAGAAACGFALSWVRRRTDARRIGAGRIGGCLGVGEPGPAAGGAAVVSLADARAARGGLPGQ